MRTREGDAPIFLTLRESDFGETAMQHNLRTPIRRVAPIVRGKITKRVFMLMLTQRAVAVTSQATDQEDNQDRPWTIIFLTFGVSALPRILKRIKRVH